MFNINNKIRILLELALITSVLFIVFNAISLFNLKTTIDLKINILLRQSIEYVCGTSRIINPEVPNYHKGHFIGTYSTDYINFNLTKPLTTDELDNVQTLFTDKCKKEFKFSGDLNTNMYSTKNIDLNNNKIGFLSLIMDFDSSLPLGGI